ncbi:MAG: hypothetical protein GPJ54_11765 [Candidatus Heimdallarchaeota archaeon]|nr:hypothetical protein [Candidatus Heimdallarchaeota archaeon]
MRDRNFKWITFILVDIISIWYLNSNMNSLVSNSVMVEILSTILLIFIGIIILFATPGYILGHQAFDHIEDLEVKTEGMRSIISRNDGA